ncbi:hypothetical protein ACFO5K_04145 [Nocardia halotolerans]|uniref:Uncharacterized protein n=1 Tax=Nocardia halotolerans TaxID=1755878 RepID=A0ABV8VBK0_9NOCA
MTTQFVRLTDDNGQPFYVRAARIDAVGVNDSPCFDVPTTILVGLEQFPCQEPVDNIIEALEVDVIEVDNPHTNHVHYTPEQAAA